MDAVSLPGGRGAASCAPCLSSGPRRLPAMPTIRSTADLSDRPWAAQSDCQVVKAVACATAARTLLRRRPGRAASSVSTQSCSRERRAAATTAGTDVHVAEHPRHHLLAAAVVAVDVQEAAAQPADRVLDEPPGVRVRLVLARQPLARAGEEQRLLVGEVPVDGGAGDPGASGDGGHRRAGRAEGAVELLRRVDDALPRALLALRALELLVGALLLRRPLLAQDVDTHPFEIDTLAIHQCIAKD